MDGRTRTVHGLIERHARSSPDSLALTAGALRLGYAELDSAAAALARTLGDGPVDDEPAFPPTPDGLISLLAVLKSGGAFHHPGLDHLTTLGAHRSWRVLLKLTRADRLLHTGAADASELLLPLTTGATLVLPDPDRPDPDPADLHRLALDRRVTVIRTDSPTAHRLLDHLRPLGLELGEVRVITVDGRRWPLAEQLHLQSYLGPDVRVLNVCGTPATAGCGTYFDPATLAEWPPDPGGLSLIGVPFPGVRVSLLDTEGKPVPDGEPGELAVELPGRPTTEDTSHRTGNLGRLRPDGILEHLGPVAAEPTPADPPPPRPEARAARRRAKPSRARSAPRSIALSALAAEPLPDAASSGSTRPADLRPGKASATAPALPRAPRWVFWYLVTVVAASLAMAVTDRIWPGSTDVTGMPEPWALLARLQYFLETMSFGYGLAFLLLGGRLLRRFDRPPLPTALALPAVTWLLVAWWPRNNLDRITAPTDWPARAALTYGFDLTLVLAALLLVSFLARPPRSRPAAAAPQATAPGRPSDRATSPH